MGDRAGARPAQRGALRPVVGDNTGTFAADTAAFLAHVRDPDNGLRSRTVPLKGGSELGVCVEPGAQVRG